MQKAWWNPESLAAFAFLSLKEKCRLLLKEKKKKSCNILLHALSAFMGVS